MSQFTLTLEEDAIITDALKSKAAQYAAMFGVADPALESLIAKLENFNSESVAEPEVVVETPQEEKPAKAKKAKAEDTAE